MGKGTQGLAEDRGASLLRGTALARKGPQSGSEFQKERKLKRSGNSAATVAVYFAIGSVGRKEPHGPVRK